MVGRNEAMRRADSKGLIAVAVAVALCTVTLCCMHLSDVARKSSGDVLMEIDGISLDSNAAAVFGSGDKNSHSQGSFVTPTDKMLHQHEVGELDGVALDANAAAELVSHPLVHVHSLSSLKRVRKAAARKGNFDSPAQELLQSGESELSAGNYDRAIMLLRKARDIWKPSGSSDYHFAQTLIDDIKRAHPKLSKLSKKEKKAKALASVTGSSAASAVHPASSHRRMQAAAKKLSSGKEFRSLYGLLRDEKAGSKQPRQYHQSMRHQSQAQAQLKLAHTMSLDQTSQSSQSTIQRTVEMELKKAEKRLERRNKLALLHEKADILRTAKMLLKGAPIQTQGLAEYPDYQSIGYPQNAAAAFASQAQQLPESAPELASQTASQMPTVAPQSQPQSLSWQSGQVPSSVRMSWPANEPASQSNVQFVEQPQQQLTIVQMQGEQPSNSVVLAADEQPPMQTAPTQYASTESLQSAPASSQDFNQALSQNAQGGSSVPVVNLNLPAGEKLPPGRYALDGSIVPDAAGQMDFVGNLVPVSSPGVI